MPRDESLYHADWLRIAEKDMSRVKLLIDANDPEAAGFYLQQATEKLLKAYLLSKGWQIERIHDLEALLNRALVYDQSLERFRLICQKISGFYLIERYPFLVDAGVTEIEVRNALEHVSGLFEKLRKGIKSK